MKIRTAISSTISTIAVLVAFAHVAWPGLSIDPLTVALLGLAFVPWLGPLFKSLEVPGGFRVEFQNQGTTENPPLPQAKSAVPPQELSMEARKVLATLWQHQTQHFGSDFTKRWTFVVGPGSVEYPAYLRGVAQLIEAGLVSVLPDSWHSVLTHPGIEYCQKDQGLEVEADTYRF